MNEEKQKQADSKTFTEGESDAVKISVSAPQDQLAVTSVPRSEPACNELDPTSHDCGEVYWREIRARIRQTISKPSERRKVLSSAIILIIACLSFSFAPNLVSMLLHNPSSFELSTSPQEGQFVFRHAILLAEKPFGGGPLYRDGIFETGRCSSSRNYGNDVTLTSWDILAIARPSDLPFAPALLPRKLPVIDAFQLIKPYHLHTNHFEIKAPKEKLVDISVINDCQEFIPTFIPTIHLGGGDYITTNLTVKKHDLDTADERVRIFIQDKSVKKGMSVEGGFINEGGKPANFQIWYNGTGKIKFTGTSRISAVIYAPNANLEIGKDVMFRGAIVCKKGVMTGGIVLFDEDLRSIKNWR